MADKIPLLVFTGIAFYFDLRYRQLPNWLLLFALPAVALRWVTGGLSDVSWGVLWAIGSHLPAYLKGWLGGGDVKLAFSLSLCLGQEFFLVWALAALYSGIWGGLMLFCRRGKAGLCDLTSIIYSGRATSGMSFPYGVALALGTWTALFWRC